jgi:hypothetical protein
MLRYECDSCKRLKEKNEDWILGFAAENIGVATTRREITFLSRWDEDQAVDWLAVHFCSEPCKQNYTSRLFADQPTGDVITESAVLPGGKSKMRVLPGGKTSKPPASKSKKSHAESRHKNPSRKHTSA